MANIVAGMASSHAYTFIDPDRWEERRALTLSRYFKRYGVQPPPQPQIADETLESNKARYQSIRGGLDRLKSAFDALHPDTLVLIADDQSENYREDNLPQLAIYVGDHVVAIDSETKTEHEVRCDTALAEHILNEAVDAGFDVASSRSYYEDRLLSHAHTQIIHHLRPEMPVVLLFVNAIHVPAPSPARCYQYGQCLRTILDAFPDDRRIVLYASGGWSHFTAGYPYQSYQGPETMGSIHEAFDRQNFATMKEGRGAELARLTSRDLLEHGDVEFRQWITLLGALQDGPKPDWLVYEPFYRAVMAMGVGYWGRN